MPLDTTTRMLAPFLDRLSHEELDVIPYGVIQLDANGVVRAYNRVEAVQAGGIPRPIGRHFFRDVCPSVDAPELYGRFAQGIMDHKLDDTFQYTLSGGPTLRRVLIRMYYSVRSRSVWLFMAKPDGSPLDSCSAAQTRFIRPTPSHGIDLRTPRVA
jgi:photoactive yellow protein